MSHMTDLKTTVSFTEERWLTDAIRSLEHLGVTYTYSPEKNGYEVHYAPIEKYRKQNLSFIRRRGVFVAVADDYLVDRELRDLMGMIEGKYNDQMVNEYARTEGFMIEDETIRDRERSVVLVRY